MASRIYQTNDTWQTKIGVLEYSMTTCIYIVQSQKNGTVRERYHLVGVYSNKQLADAAGKEHCDELNDFYEEQQHYSVTILPLDGIIDELNN